MLYLLRTAGKSVSQNLLMVPSVVSQLLESVDFHFVILRVYENERAFEDSGGRESSK